MTNLPDPPAGHQWILQRNILVYDNTGLGLGEASLNIPPAFDGITTYTSGQNVSIPSAADYVLETLWYAQVITYLNHAQYGLMAVEPGKASASGYITVPGGLTSQYSGGVPVFSHLEIPITYVVSSSSPGGTLGVQLVKVVGDVWAAMPTSSKLTTLNPNSPLTTSAQQGFAITWPRSEERIDATRHTLGEIGGLTWPHMWDGEKRFMLDGLHLTVRPHGGGGYETHCDYQFTKIPNTDPLGGTANYGTPVAGGVALTDITNTDDLYYRTI